MEDGGGRCAWLYEGPLPGVFGVLRSKPTRAERERLFARALAAYESGEMTMTEARIAAGLASRPAKLAYRFPRLLGHLCAIAAADRMRPLYAPEEGWRFTDAGVTRIDKRRPPRGLRNPHPDEVLEL